MSLNPLKMHSISVDAVTELRSVLSTPHMPEVKQTLQQIRPELSEESLEFRAAVLLLTGPQFTFNIDRLAVRTQIPRNVVAACARRLFDNGVWQPDGPVYTWRSADDSEFWQDVGVAAGKLCRRMDRLGRIEWANAGSWRKAYEASDPEQETLTVLYSPQAAPAPEEVVPVSTEEPAAREEVRVPMRPRAERVRSRPEPQRVQESAVVTSGAPKRSDLFPGADWLI